MDTKIQCLICNKEFCGLSGLKNHINIHALSWNEYKTKTGYIEPQKQIVKCKMCGKEIAGHRTYCSYKCSSGDPDMKIARIKKIIRVEPGNKLKCNYCEYTTSDINNFAGNAAKHIKIQHNIITDSKTYLTHYTIQENIKTLETTVCPICGWKSYAKNINVAMGTHLSRKHPEITLNEFFEKYPEFKKHWKHYCELENRTKFLEAHPDNYIECKICGMKLKEISNTHCEVHGITKREYKKRFGQKSTLSLASRLRFKENYAEGLMLYEPDYSSEQEIEITTYLKTKIQNVRIKDRTILTPQEIDIFIPDLNIAIEYNGLYWHSEIAGNKDKFYHYTKTKKCQEKGIRLIHIFSDEYLNNKEIVLQRLNNILGLNNSLVTKYAKNTNIQPIDPSTKDSFLLKYHLQGKDKSSIKLGCFDNDTNELLAVMTFGRPRQIYGNKNNQNNEYELIRYCGNYNYKLVGLGGKLMSYFKNNYNPIKIITYSDKRWGTGSFYNSIGFSKVKETDPNYFYIPKGYTERLHRYNFTKQRIIELGGNPELSESENMVLLGFDRIWDCGNCKYEWNQLP